MKKLKKETSIKAVSKKKLSIDVDDKNKGGRPPVVLSDEQIKEIEEMAAYLKVEQIADSLGIDRTTFYEVLKRQPEVSLHYKKGRARKIYRYAKILESKAFGMNENELLKYDTTSIIFFLKTQAGWSEKQPEVNTEKRSLEIVHSFISSKNSNNSHL